MTANAEPVPERRRAEALRAAAAALDTLGGGTVDDLLRVAEWVLDAHRPQVQQIDDEQLHRELAETDIESELDNWKSRAFAAEKARDEFDDELASIKSARSKEHERLSIRVTEAETRAEQAEARLERVPQLELARESEEHSAEPAPIGRDIARLIGKHPSPEVTE